MQVAETKAEGLIREYQVALPAADLIGKMEGELKTLQAKAQIKGFRPGKAPISFLRRMYGRGLTQDVLSKAIEEANRHIIQTHALQPVRQPEVNLPLDEQGLEKLFDGTTGELSYTMSFEVLPKFDIVDFSSLSFERPVCAVSEEEVDKAIEQLALRVREFTPRPEGEPAQNGDQLTVDHEGRIDGAPFEGGTGKGLKTVLGAGQLLPGLDEQLIGAKKGEARKGTTRFPKDFGNAILADKEAEFDFVVTEVAAPNEQVLDDEFAKKMGANSFEELRTLIKNRIESEHQGVSRQKLKRRILDALATHYTFEIPKTLLEQELGVIGQGLAQSRAQTGVDAVRDEAAIAAERAEFLPVAERRVRLGLFFGEFVRVRALEVTQDELSNAVLERVRQYPGQEEQVWNFYKGNKQAVEEIRMNLLENKSIELITSEAKVTDKPVTREELYAVEE